MKPFVVTGTGRCGTGYMQMLLQACGVNCGHESLWTMDRRGDSPEALEDMERWGFKGDCSCRAAPNLVGFKGTVIHLVREPAATVNSLVGNGIFKRPAEGTFEKFQGFAGRFVEFTGDEVLDSIRFYVAWNMMVDRSAPDLLVRVEDAEKVVPLILETVGARVPDGWAELVAKVPAQVNRWGQPSAYTLDQLAAKDRTIEVMARRYGYI